MKNSSIFILFALMAVFPLLQSCEGMNEDLYAYETWDKDADTFIGQDEFIAGSSTIGYYGMWDLDESGKITGDELQTGYKRYGIESDAGKTINEMDVNNDQALNEDEFLKGMYRYYDTNNDGKIDRAEYDAIIWEK